MQLPCHQPPVPRAAPTISPPLYQAPIAPLHLSHNPFSAHLHEIHQPDLQTLGTQMKTGLSDTPASQNNKK